MKKFFGIALLASLLFSCSSHDDNSNTTDLNSNYHEGIFLTNEGNFGKANASISWIDKSLTSIKNNIFDQENGSNLGDVAQSMTFNDDLAYLVVNASNVVEVVHKNTFKKIATITQNIVEPRYAVVENDLLYVTNSNQTVTVYNATNFQYIQSIALDFNPEHIVESNNKLYVVSNSWTVPATVAVINLPTYQVEKTINFPSAINGLTEEDGNVYVLTTSARNSTIETLSGTAHLTTSTLPQTDARYLSEDQGNLYFTSNLGIYAVAIAQLVPNANAVELFKVSDNSWSSLYGFNVFDGKFFTADAKGFTEASEITIYTVNGTILTTFKGGIGTNGFYQED